MTPKPAPLLLLAFEAGLATGLARFWDPLVVFLVLALAGAVFRQRLVGVCCVAALIGRGSGEIAWRLSRDSCASRLPEGGVTLEVQLAEPVLPDARIARGVPRGAGCAGEIGLRLPSGPLLPAGSVVRVSGRWIPRGGRFARPDGLLVVREFAVTGSDPTLFERLRTWLATTVRRLYGSRSGTVDALVVNRRGAMPPELRDRYARAGLVHILSISGFHVGIIVGWIVLLGRLAGLNGPRAQVVAAAAAGIYVMFLGWPAPAARAALLAGLAAQFHLRQRNVQAMSLLAATCLAVVLLDPWAALDPGAWLSAGALTGALAATRWSDRALGAGWFWRTLSGSIGATLATAPITAALFGSVSLAGVGLNFIAIPLAAIAVPGILLSLLAAALAPPLAPALATGSGALLGLLDQVAWWGGLWQGAAVTVPAEPASALPWVALLVVAGWSIAGGAPRWEAARRVALAGAAAAWILLLADGFRGADADTGLTLHFLDVGQGDAAAIHTPGGHWVLVDGGPAGEGGDAGRRVVVPFLQRHRVARVDLMVLSHAHADHLGGLPAVVERYRTSEVLDPADLVSDPLYAGFLAELDAEDVRWVAGRAGTTFAVDSVRFTILHPDTTWAGWQDDLNEDSIVLLLEYGGFRALFAGDAGLPVEARLARRIGRVDLLKVGHHGSRSATSDAWLDELSPGAAVISTGRGNRYGHPHAEVLERLRRHGVPVWRTDEDGSITVMVDSLAATVTGGRRHERLSLGVPAPGGSRGGASEQEEVSRKNGN